MVVDADFVVEAFVGNGATRHKFLLSRLFKMLETNRLFISIVYDCLENACREKDLNIKEIVNLLQLLQGVRIVYCDDINQNALKDAIEINDLTPLEWYSRVEVAYCLALNIGTIATAKKEDFNQVDTLVRVFSITDLEKRILPDPSWYLRFLWLLEKLNKKSRFIIILGFVFISLGGVQLWVLSQKYCSWKVRKIENKSGNECVSAKDLLGTSGEFNHFITQSKFILREGMKAFKDKNYQEAKRKFEEARNIDKGDPMPQIYLNNTIARSKGKPFKIAVVLPIQHREDVAVEMLRGVADAQTNFKGVGNRLLEVVIYNDQSREEVAKGIAQEIIKDPTVIAVIGHSESDSSEAGLSEYEKAQLPMITPGSTSTSLKGDFFFRVLPSDQKNGQKLAQYAKEQKISNVLIFYDSTSIYSQSLKEAFVESFQKKDGEIRYQEEVDFNNDKYWQKMEKEYLQNNRVDTILLIPAADTIEPAISIAKKNRDNGLGLNLLGGDIMYNSSAICSKDRTVTKALGGIVLSIPWEIKIKGQYAIKSAQRWGDSLEQPGLIVNWHTAMAYDATQAIIESLSENSNRKSVFENLKELEIKPEKTSGESLRFFRNGDSNREPMLVQLKENLENPNCNNFEFSLISKKGW